MEVLNKFEICSAPRKIDSKKKCFNLSHVQNKVKKENRTIATLTLSNPLLVTLNFDY